MFELNVAARNRMRLEGLTRDDAIVVIVFRLQQSFSRRKASLTRAELTKYRRAMQQLKSVK